MKQWLGGLIVLWIAVSSLTTAQSLEEVMGRIDPSTHHDFVIVPPKYTKHAGPVYVRVGLYTAFLSMWKAAHASGVDLRITSGRRGFDEQVDLFSAYGYDRALPPGTSSHHRGNAIDIGKEAHHWLQDNASRFGFCQTYDGHSSAQEAESWHYEYQPELFRKYLVAHRDSVYAYLIKHNIIGGTGSLSKQELFDTYIYPISHACIDSYPSRIDDVLTGIRFDRKLDSDHPDHVVYILSRYKFPAGSGLLAVLPPEIRFEKKGYNFLGFASLMHYPKTVKDLLIRYDDWFRTGIERFVLLRAHKQLLLHAQQKISYVHEK